MGDHFAIEKDFRNFAISMEAFLDSLRSSDKSSRRTAEEYLETHEVAPGFALQLIEIASSESQSIPRRQICLTVTKDLIRRRWSELIDTDKRSLLERLVPLSLSRNPSIRLLSHACVASGASIVGVKNWPDLLQSIRESLLSTEVSVEVKHSILQLLETIIEECGGAAFVAVAGTVEEMLIGACKASVTLRRKSLSAWTSMLFNLAMDEELAALNACRFQEWKELLVTLISSEEVGDSVAALRSITRMLSLNNMSSILRPLIVDLVPQSIALLSRHQSTFNSLVILSEEGGIDEDDDNAGLMSLVICICEMMNAVVNAEDDLISEVDLDRFLTAICFYVQIPVSIEEEWLSSASDFIAQEQEDLASSTSIRIVFEGLIADIFMNPHISNTGVKALLSSAFSMVDSGVSRESEGDPEAWRVIEAGLFVLGLASSELNTASLPSQIGDILKLAARLSLAPETKPLLKARALLVLSKFADVLQEKFAGDLNTVLQCAAVALDSEFAPVLYAGCMAFNAMLPKINGSDLSELVRSVLEKLVLVARTSKDSESLHFCLEALIGIARYRPDIVPNQFGEFIAHMLEQHADDPLVPTQLVELMEAREDQSMYEPIAKVVKPWIRKEEEFKLDIALDFMVEIVRHAPVPYSGSVLDCILVLNESDVAQVGPNTAELVSEILQTCAIRQS